MIHYSTLSEAINGLHKEGYTLDFNLKNHCIECVAIDLTIHPEAFNVDKYYRFEGISDPGDNSIVYAISAETGEKGVLVDAYGMYSESLTPQMIRKLTVEGEGI
ncbi:MAG: phosphoribosylpyrophosphate synthetase [Bacteroidota bacterium]|nr:phosphoribosylpyrophosphate synthetase [Bacteroidota bacterium]